MGLATLMSWLTDVITTYSPAAAAFAFMLSQSHFTFLCAMAVAALGICGCIFVPFHEAPELVAQNDIPLTA